VHSFSKKLNYEQINNILYWVLFSNLLMFSAFGLTSLITPYFYTTSFINLVGLSEVSMFLLINLVSLVIIAPLIIFINQLADDKITTQSAIVPSDALRDSETSLTSEDKGAKSVPAYALGKMISNSLRDNKNNVATPTTSNHNFSDELNNDLSDDLSDDSDDGLSRTL
jgi:uncharacterized membrane protein